MTFDFLINSLDIKFAFIENFIYKAFIITNKDKKKKEEEKEKKREDKKIANKKEKKEDIEKIRINRD